MSQGLGASDLLSVWEGGLGRHGVDRALLVLATALRQEAQDDFAGLTLGQRDGWLLAIRAATFGDRMEARAECPACAAPVEFELRASELAVAAEEPCRNPAFEAEAEGVKLRLRRPDSRDVAFAAAAPDAAAALHRLRGRCIIAVGPEGDPTATQDLAETVLDHAARQIAERDPQADLAVELRCPSCSEVWRLPFDIASFFWEEIGSAARRLLLEVDTLARAYGWCEADILAMSPARRHLYLHMAC